MLSFVLERSCRLSGEVRQSRSHSLRGQPPLLPTSRCPLRARASDPHAPPPFPVSGAVMLQSGQSGHMLTKEGHSQEKKELFSGDCVITEEPSTGGKKCLDRDLHTVLARGLSP